MSVTPCSKVLLKNGHPTGWPFCIAPNGQNTLMKQTGKCPKCGSVDILADVKAVDRAHGNLEKEMSLATYRWAGAFLFKG